MSMNYELKIMRKEGIDRGLFYGTIPTFLWKVSKNLCQENRSTVHDSNSEHPEDETWLLTIVYSGVKGEGEVVPVLFCKLCTMPWRRIGEWRYSSTHSLISALDGGEWSASRPGRFTIRERAPATIWIGGWVGLREILDAVVKRKIPSPRRNRTLEPQLSSP
jgi:hypothetical protein